MQYEINQHYRILGFGTKISPPYRQKLLSLGLLPGISFQVKHIAPLGNPLSIETRRGTFMVRLQDLSDLDIEFTA